MHSTEARLEGRGRDRRGGIVRKKAVKKSPNKAQHLRALVRMFSQGIGIRHSNGLIQTHLSWEKAFGLPTGSRKTRQQNMSTCKTHTMGCYTLYHTDPSRPKKAHQARKRSAADESAAPAQGE